MDELLNDVTRLAAEARECSALADSSTDAADKEYYRKKELLLREKEVVLLKMLASRASAADLGVGSAPMAAVLERLEERLDEIKQQQQEAHQFSRLILSGQFKPTSSGSSRDTKAYRQTALNYYGYTADSKTVQCMVTGEDMPCGAIIAGHIFRQSWNTAMLPLLGITTVHDPRNIILVRSEVEAAFDRFELAIIPESGADDSGLGADGSCLRIHVLKPSLLTGPQTYIGKGGVLDGKKWVDVHKNKLHLEEKNPPARRLLAMHALLAIRHATHQGWMAPGTLAVPETGWASPGFDSALMRRFLTEASGAADDTSEHPEEQEQQAEQELAEVGEVLSLLGT